MKKVNEELWDVVIIGTGMGGGSVGYKLAQLGYKVLFVEKGGSTHELMDSYTGSQLPGFLNRLAAGWWPTKITTNVDNIESDIFAPIGCGVGGSTAHYGGALERFSPEDFFVGDNYHLPEKSTAVSSWPITYKEMSPFYDEAEVNLVTSGEHDPLSHISNEPLLNPEKLSEVEQHFMDSFVELGFHPYKLPRCADKFSVNQAGVKLGNKVGSQEAFVRPAIEKFGAVLYENCEVLKLDADEQKISSARCVKDGRIFEIKAKIFVLSAGAVFTPALLLKSANQYWQDGLANKSGLVGRNLMFHGFSQVAIWPNKKIISKNACGKSIAFRDFYIINKIKLGAVQSFGVEVGRVQIFNYMISALNEKFGIQNLPKLLKLILKVVALITGKILGKAQIFTCVLEDFPYWENQIKLSQDKPSGISVEYTVPDELKERDGFLRKQFKKALKGHRVVGLDRGVNLNFGHPCGTCKFGEDSLSSVLDPNCKAHDLENLYVCDSSFFPSSGGVNPSLTIAANGLRVAGAISNELVAVSNEKETLQQRQRKQLNQSVDTNNIHYPMNIDVSISREISKKIVIITNVVSDLGRSLAINFSKEGAVVIGLGRDAGKLKETSAFIKSDVFKYYKVDSYDNSAISKIFKSVVAEYGEINVLINNPEVYPRASMDIDSIDDWWQAISINLKGCAICSSVALPYMKKRGYGRILNVGGFEHRQPLPGRSVCSVSKGGVHALTKAMAKEINRVIYPDICINEFILDPMNIQVGGDGEPNPDECYQAIRNVVITEGNNIHGRIFTKEGEMKAPVGIKERFKLKLKRVMGMS